MRTIDKQCIVYQYTLEARRDIVNRLENVIRIGASVAIWALIVIFSIPTVLMPVVLAGLLSEYQREYSLDFLTLTVLVEIPMVLFIALLSIVLLLLRRISVDRIFSKTAHHLVRRLSYNAAILALSLVVIMIWLFTRNAFPPGALIVLTLGVLLFLAVALVSRTLLGLLKEATAASDELEGVI